MAQVLVEAQSPAEEIIGKIDSVNRCPQPKFDSQGYVTFMDPISLDAMKIYKIDVNSLDPDKKAAFLINLVSENKTEGFTTALNKLYSNSPHQGMINLEEEMRFHLAGVLKAYRKCLPDNSPYIQTINKIYTDSLNEDFFNEIQEAFKKALVDSFETKTINLKKLNQALDKLRPKFQKKVLANFKSAIDERRLPRVDKDKFKKALETTSAFGEIEIIQVEKNTTDNNHNVGWLKGSKITSHDKENPIAADIPYKIYTKDRDNPSKLLYSTVRTPLLSSKEKIEKLIQKYYPTPVPVAPAAPVDALAAAPVDALAAAPVDALAAAPVDALAAAPVDALAAAPVDALAAARPEAVFYHLLTSYYTKSKPFQFLFDKLKNKQTEKADILMQEQDSYNKEVFEAGSTKPLFFTLHTPVNGFGEHISSTHSNEKIQEIAWRNNLALIMMVGTKEQKEKIKNLYRVYLTVEGEKSVYLNALKTNIGEIILKLGEGPEAAQPVALPAVLPVDQPAVPPEVPLVAQPEKDPSTLAKSLLIKIVKNKYHEKHPEFIRLFSALSLAVNHGNSFVGCKSGNERTGMILNRLEVLLKNPKLITDANGSDKLIEALGTLTTELEKTINEQNINGFANNISLNDQHAPTKIMPQYKPKWYKWFNPFNYINPFFWLKLYNTNNAESADVDALVTKGASKLQAHKNKYALETASKPDLKSIIAKTLLAVGTTAVGILSILGMISGAILTGPIILPILITLGALGVLLNKSDKKSPEFIFSGLLTTIGILSLPKIMAIIGVAFSSFFPPALLAIGALALSVFIWKSYKAYQANKPIPTQGSELASANNVGGGTPAHLQQGLGLDGPDALARVVPADALARVVPADALARVVPADALARVVPADAPDRVVPADAPARVVADDQPRDAADDQPRDAAAPGRTFP